MAWAASRRVSVWYSDAPGAPTFLIDAPEYFARNSIYGFRDDHERFAFFCRASSGALQATGPAAGDRSRQRLALRFCRRRASRRAAPTIRFTRRTRTLFSIHNLAYQGAFDPGRALAGWASADEEREAFMLNGAASALKAGLMTSDALSTVSRRYALEIQTPEQGTVLNGFCARAAIGSSESPMASITTSGIRRPIRTSRAHFDADNLAGKRNCKLDLLRRFGLPEDWIAPSSRSFRA